MDIFERIQLLRMRLREYPAYRIIERMLRISLWGGAAAAINMAIQHWTGQGIDPELTLQMLWSAAIFAGLDKLKNEWRIIRQEYDFSTWQGIKSLFQRD